MFEIIAANTPNKMEHLKPNMLTEMDGNPPIYITKRRTPQGEEIYVNNAMILKSRSNVDLKNENGKRQVSREALIDVLEIISQPLMKRKSMNLL